MEGSATKGVTFAEPSNDRLRKTPSLENALEDIKEVTMEGSYMDIRTGEPAKPVTRAKTAAPQKSNIRRTVSDKSMDAELQQLATLSEDEDVPAEGQGRQSKEPISSPSKHQKPDSPTKQASGIRRTVSQSNVRKTPGGDGKGSLTPTQMGRKSNLAVSNGYDSRASNGNDSRLSNGYDSRASRPVTQIGMAAEGLSSPSVLSRNKVYIQKEESKDDMCLVTDVSRGNTKLQGKRLTPNAWSSTTLSSQAPTEASSDEPDDHINVVLRVRPLNGAETTRKDQFIVSLPGAGKIEVDNNGSVRQFGYNVVFEPEATQEDLLEHSGVKKLIDMALNGYACTALAFGQTGSGKTHTMTGPPQQFQEGKQVDPDMYGIIQRSLRYLFEQLSQQQGNKVIRASYLEIYNEQVIDLLNPNMRRYLQVRWSKHRGFYVENLFIVECESVDDLMAVLEEGEIQPYVQGFYFFPT